MRKFIVGILLTLTAFLLIACSGDKKSEKKSEKESEVKEEVVSGEDDMEEIIGEFGEGIEEKVNDENNVEDTSLQGKKLSEIYAAGFEYNGCGGDGIRHEVI